MRPALRRLALLAALATACGGCAPSESPSLWSVAPDQSQPQPVAEAIAWRYDGSEGQPMIDVWLSSRTLNADERQTLRPRREGISYTDDTQPETLGLAGLLLRFDDSGSDRRAMLAFCLPAEHGVDCSGGSGLGRLVLRSISAERVKGEFYSRSSDGKTLYVARFDTPLANESGVALPAGAIWAEDPGEPGKAFLASNAAMVSGDLATLKRHSLPERQADYDDPDVLTFLKRMAMDQPHVLSRMQHDDMARIWVQDQTAKGDLPPGVVTVDMQRVDGEWRVAQTRQ